MHFILKSSRKVCTGVLVSKSMVVGPNTEDNQERCKRFPLTWKSGSRGSPALYEREAGYTLDRSPIHRRGIVSQEVWQDYPNYKKCNIVFGVLGDAGTYDTNNFNTFS
ncbi:hypothetical protein AMECASPLE_021480 [Ameca splendens]|uniref:Uncharacterized protein n=1 Tax=Ameca splendens TaxID=208324 RepID=A0ABV0ZR46_9TELE